MNRAAAAIATMCLVTMGVPGCRRSPPAHDSPTACEFARGEWVGDDIDAADASASERTVAREMVRMDRWTITAESFDTVQAGQRASEDLRVVDDARDHCTVDLERSGEHRTLRLESRGAERLRITGPGLRTGILLRRAP